jgi:hypothetical protein
MDPITQLCNSVRELVQAEWRNFQEGCHRPPDPASGTQEQRVERRVARYRQRQARILEIRRLMTTSLAAGIQANATFETVERRLSDLLEAVNVLSQWERMVPCREPGGVAFLGAPGDPVEFQPTDSIDDQAEELLGMLAQAVETRLPGVENLASALGDPNAELGRAVEAALRQPAADIAATAGFNGQLHDALLAQLRDILDATLPETPRISILQGLQDRGCDLLIEWPGRAKYGVQLKNNYDVEHAGFAANTVTQIQDSRQHGLARLFVVLAADITGNSNLQKVRAIESRISSMNDPYVGAVPPERAWNLLFPAQPPAE